MNFKVYKKQKKRIFPKTECMKLKKTPTKPNRHTSL